MKKGLIILASANSQGDTRQLVDYFNEKVDYPIIDLKTKNIGHFDYEFKNKEDDFHALIEEIVEKHELIIFATPVYWYSMSGLLKVFFDRLSDCLMIRKELGRHLRGKQMAVLTCGFDEELKPGFHMPFKETAKYLSIEYAADVHGWVEKKVITETIKDRLDSFVEKVENLGS